MTKESKLKAPVKSAELTLAPAGEPLTETKQASPYDGGFHLKPVQASRKPGQRIIGKRSALQSFTC